MGMRQVNTNGLSLFEMNDSCPVLYKCMDEAVKAPAFKPSKDGKFNGVVWRVDYNDDKAVVWLADYSQSNYSKINVVTRYECDVKGAGDFPIEAFDDGIHLVKVSTDADGKIASISPRYDALDKGVEEFYIKPTSNKITDYVKKVCDYSVTDASGTTIKAYYEKPIFGGTDKGVRALNDAIDKMEKNYAKTVSGDILKRELDDLLGFASPNAEYKYSPVRLYSVYYDNNVASVGFDSDWYMGGVYNVMYSGVNIDLNTGRILGIDEVMDMSMPYVKDVIAQALDEQYDVDKQYALSKLTEMQNIPFWFDDNYIYVGFGSYELEMGTGYCVVYIDR